jgi:hypothetical protein
MTRPRYSGRVQVVPKSVTLVFIRCALTAIDGGENWAWRHTGPAYINVCVEQTRAAMKVLFLDIDGVLNTGATKERIGAYIGINIRLAKLFLEWIEARPSINVVLSSTWRLHDDMKAGLTEAGIKWIDQTPQLETRAESIYLAKTRGQEIEAYLLDHPEVARYAIIDDYSDMLPHQRRYFVQTSYARGLEPKHLRKLDEILEEGEWKTKN